MGPGGFLIGQRAGLSQAAAHAGDINIETRNPTNIAIVAAANYLNWSIGIRTISFMP